MSLSPHSQPPGSNLNEVSAAKVSSAGIRPQLPARGAPSSPGRAWLKSSPSPTPAQGQDTLPFLAFVHMAAPFFLISDLAHPSPHSHRPT